MKLLSNIEVINLENKIWGLIKKNRSYPYSMEYLEIKISDAINKLENSYHTEVNFKMALIQGGKI